jgi:UDP-xylose/UDP-N-acetylglucosamine transporter B4
MSSTTSAVTLNLVLSVRKFTSLVISIVLFGNDFGSLHWFGTGLVIGGMVVYSAGGKEPDLRRSSSIAKSKNE